MKRPFLSTLLGCLFVSTASVLMTTRTCSTHGVAEKPPITRSRDRHPRPASGVSPSRLLEITQQFTPDNRDAWARSLDKAELKHLTLALINAYQGLPKSQNDIALWLTPLAKEWGRRDIHSLFDEMNRLGPEFFTNTQSAWFVFSNVRAAALIGLSGTDPATAFQHLLHPEVSDSMYLIYMGSETSEAIFSNWAQQDPTEAWYEFSNSPVAKWGSFEALRSLIANCSDSHLHEEILQWVVAYKRPANPPTSGSFIKSAALGLAAHDPEKAWTWLRSRYDAQNGNTIEGSELFESSAHFLSSLAARRPQEAITLMNRHPELITILERHDVGYTLLNYEPEVGLEVFAKDPDLERREEWVNTWIGYILKEKVYTRWDLVESIPRYLPRSECLRRIVENLDRLGLPASTTAELRLSLQTKIAARSKAHAEPP